MGVLLCRSNNHAYPNTNNSSMDNSCNHLSDNIWMNKMRKINKEDIRELLRRSANRKPAIRMPQVRVQECKSKDSKCIDLRK